MQLTLAIAKNEKFQAMEFLSKFAKLVRSTLNASSLKKITLSNEIDLLKNYLELEKMRFKDKFEYNFEVDESIDLEEIEIPPLMIQPFVENAIIHGFKGIEEKGLLIIRFQLMGNRLEVIVEDNGTGIQQVDDKKTHKSMAISVTKQRLSHLNKIRNDQDLVIKGRENGQGTIVKMNFYLDEQDE